MSSASPKGPPPVHLVHAERASPFTAGRGIAMARVEGDGLRALDIRDGDHVILARRDEAEHGDLAAVLEEDGPACLWKVYPQEDGLRLSMGHPAFDRPSRSGARVQGVVLGVLRGLSEA